MNYNIFHYFKQTQDTSLVTSYLNSTSYSTLFQSRISNDINIILLQQNISLFLILLLTTMLINFPLFIHVSLHLITLFNIKEN